MRKKLDAVHILLEAWDESSSVGDQVHPRLDCELMLVEPVLERFRPREDPDAFASLQAIARFRLDDVPLCTQVALALSDSRSGHPQVGDPYAVAPLILLGVLEEEEIRYALDVVLVQVREGQDVHIVAAQRVKPVADGPREIDAPIARIVRVGRRGVVEEQNPARGSLNQAGVGVAEREECEPVHRWTSLGLHRPWTVVEALKPCFG